MKTLALGFVFGAWLLQQQAKLPSLAFLFTLFLFILIIAFISHLASKKAVFTPILKSFLRLTFCLGAIFCGFLWANLLATHRLNQALPVAWQQKSINIVGVIASLPEVNERGVRFRFDVEKVYTKDATLKVPNHISLNFYPARTAEKSAFSSQFLQFQAGERWQFSVKLKRPHSTYNPHGFDFEAWALAENSRATGTISAKSGYKKLNNFVLKPAYLIESAREKVGRYITKTLINKPYAGVVRALVIGDDSQISTADWQIYLRTGVNHLVSISGLHITMLAGLAYAISAFFWRRVPSLVMRLPTRKAATLFGLMVAVIYALLAGMSIPTQRTLIMLITFAMALLFGRNMRAFNALCLALLIVVVLDPWAVIAPGFWLSFGAVALITFASVNRLKSFLGVKNAINTQWAVTLGLLPLIIAMFGQASFISPIANALAIPIVSLLVVPLAIAGAVLHADFLLHMAHSVLAICMQALTWFSTFPVWQQAAPPTWAILTALLGVFWLLLPRGFPQRWLGFVLMLPLFFVPQKRLNLGEMQMAVLDVGQGLSMVIKTAKHTLLYDAGPAFSANNDAGSRIILPYLRGQGIKKIDGFLLSHNDTDHTGGANSVLAQMPVDWIASSFNLPEAWQKPANVRTCFAGQHWVWDNVKFEVLHPQLADLANLTTKDNNQSCVVKVTSQFGSVLLTGDIEREAEMALLATNANALASDVIIVPHHGSKTSSTPGFVQAVGAKISIFTVGYLNRFKHPKLLIENNYKDNGALVLRSDYSGAVLINFAQNQPIKPVAWRLLAPHYWHDRYQ